MDARRRRWAWGMVLLGIVLLVGGRLWPAPDDSDGGGPAADPPTRDSSTVVAGRSLPEATTVPRQPGDPLRILIPELDVDARVLPVLAPGGVLTPPSDAEELGWWADGARPGDRGSALLTGHTVSTGGGALDELEELGRGDAIRVRSEAARTDYRVTSVQTLDKGDLARRAEQLFDQDVPGRLVVVTCEDWNGDVYLSNVVVTARPASTR